MTVPQAAAAVLVTALVAAAGPAGAEDQRRPEAASGRELARRVERTRETSGFRIRARLVMDAASESTARPAVLQLRLLGRREDGVTRLLFQVLWPKRLKGHAAVVERAQAPPLAGFLFDPPDRVTPLTPAGIAAPFAGTPLTLEDLADDFWGWPIQTIGGEGRDGDASCTLLESRPSRRASAYSRVRSCVDEKRALPRWVEKYAPGGALRKRFAFERRASASGTGHGRLTMVVSDGSGLPQARVEFLSSERELTIPRSEFSADRLGRLGEQPGTEGRPPRAKD